MNNDGCSNRDVIRVVFWARVLDDLEQINASQNTLCSMFLARLFGSLPERRSRALFNGYTFDKR